ncbi:hypothetical protein F511_13450 [Dorcoceras hygrometricum]|uniref:Uncharacterized protein n=1 Tax=Dorcoceras hygrometricum TaxID=472368 RepID=A0A2Z7AKB2_9LAMI|nr:hypothetical protein F511_13450 [Dorcoceras hygrometricum]
MLPAYSRFLMHGSQPTQGPNTRTSGSSHEPEAPVTNQRCQLRNPRLKLMDQWLKQRTSGSDTTVGCSQLHSSTCTEPKHHCKPTSVTCNLHRNSNTASQHIQQQQYTNQHNILLSANLFHKGNKEPNLTRLVRLSHCD